MSSTREDRVTAESFTRAFFGETRKIMELLDDASIERLALKLAQVRQAGGRLFLLGVGGSAGSASHATNDFRKLAGFEAYCPTDNVSELTARTNDEGWDTVFAAWLAGSRLAAKDVVLVFSVGGGDLERNVSANLVKAIQYAKSIGATITGVVGRDGGYTAKVADVCVLIPTVNPDYITPHTEAFHGLVWHLLVSHPALKASSTKWESVNP